MDTTYRGLGSLIYAVLRDERLRRRLIDDPDSRTLAAEETLRWEPPTALVNPICPRAVRFRGEVIPAGSVVLLALASGNRDPAVLPDPDRFNIYRNLDGTLAFGFGTHCCIGVHLARAEMVVALDAILVRLRNIRLADDVKIVGLISNGMRGPDMWP